MNRSGIVQILHIYYITNAIKSGCLYDLSGRERANFCRESVKVSRTSNYVQILLSAVIVNCKIVSLRSVTKAHRHAETLDFLGKNTLKQQKTEKIQKTSSTAVFFEKNAKDTVTFFAKATAM